ncbi:hypothetical protein EHI8A_182900 [Entamoeba histolytica HM-1:IMSS-B]|uniref:Uncharacterized protein n=5 Tax=Entamoeba histolytica TaxID=5759 RepID=B1N5I4_ENTH1|nr:hypothetical protein EHI_039960 [Entamoeba histolytica HM-1:IMSS]XP_655819.1 hypothetical protein EHI_150450 [Entamoeba histolytica HM-1:IMSS]EMD46208.1 Hypothetical protein EHI5A_161580 [Entamoeba histolytica KU27]EMH77403.1 hypothetical protein EHI8A_182900 [Entamoeba histolytica HM-1:IMSS-B]ENY61952.1 hypothetical protein EHI7A_161690 [Entamoeba histolytica HM-1:IMSS-A]GAT95306.1 hypothetical protein CL6EHI_150450 [Entamoeba histolytica]EAL50433.1 hypothetical protein EHI_150450 [Entamo|eukprot:XP_001914450.1 hypothetical protein EHI_039960 [Entamoeba histolytica HM-1:IMSS]
MKSSFVPCSKETYEVIEGNEIETIRSQSSLSDNVISTTPSFQRKSLKKARWRKSLKEKAVTLGKDIGISNTLRYLKKFPEYQNLCASTLYYWIRAEERESSSVSQQRL